MYLSIHFLLILHTLFYCIFKNMSMISHDFIQVYFFILLGTLWATLEVQIEGKFGWAAKLPTTTFLETKFTWYHVIMNLMVILIVFETVEWSWRLPFWVSGLFLIEDYMWFMVNPDFGIIRYDSEHVRWHTWGILGLGTFMPQGNWLSIFIMSGCAICDMLITNSYILWWQNIAVLVYLVVATILNKTFGRQTTKITRVKLDRTNSLKM